MDLDDVCDVHFAGGGHHWGSSMPFARFNACSVSFHAKVQPHVGVIVLGDIGRSPRMQYHATSLAKHGCEVSLIGYAGAQPTSDVLNNPRIHIRHIVTMDLPPSLPFTIRAGLKVLFLCFGLLKLLLSGPRFDVLLVQNPPAVPTLVLARLIATLQGASLIIDFHNFGYSLLALKLGEAHLIVHVLGRMADDAFCVTAQMQSRLANQWHVRATPLHDRPAAMFRLQWLTSEKFPFLVAVLLAGRHPCGSNMTSSKSCGKRVF
eukprot:symbB.v1.2.027383.t1/scaffold2713.1/size74948/3